MRGIGDPTRLLAGLVFAVALTTTVHAETCANTEAALIKLEGRLPTLDLRPPLHKELVCITIETLMDFTRRVTMHVKKCPASHYAEKAETWSQTRADYVAQFRRRHCKRTL